MKINFDAVQGKQKTETEYRVTQTNHLQNTKSSQAVSFMSHADSQQVYGKQGKSLEDLKNETSQMDAASYKKYMVVMANSMSEQDFAALIKDGVKTGRVEVKEAVTIMDHIKAAMAQSGNVIAGFNGEGDISMDKLEAMAGNPVSAQAILGSFQENDIPLTEENVKQTMEEARRAGEITDFTDGMKQYLLENEYEPTIENLYKAQFSVTGQNKGGKSGYFADDLNGYYGKKPKEIDLAALADQMEKVIKEAGLSVTEETKQEAVWLLEKSILLTGDNLRALERMNTLSLPMKENAVISHIAEAIGEGKQASQANLAAEGIVSQAKQLVETVAGITDKALQQVVAKGEILNIRNLERAQREITENPMQQIQNTDTNFLHAQRLLQETRLAMTVQANILLLKSDYSIETAQLEQLVDNLKQMERGSGKTEQNGLYQKTNQTLQEIRELPAAVLWDVSKNKATYTLHQVYEQGTILKSTYDKAGETYEALMTKPRADLGDRMKAAFSNIPELLQDTGMEDTPDNQRAVRILAYNQMEITQENIESVREADAMLKHLLEQMKPAATLKMIRDGVNPLEENMTQLGEYLSSQEEDFTQETERFSKFIYKLDQNKEISAQERESYIGIYRLLRQIEKGDGKAIGTVIANGQELSFANLLSAVRTNQKKGIQAVVDDDFGFLTDVNQKGVNISDQINSYYAFKAASLLNESTTVDAQYNRQEYEKFRQAVNAPMQAVEYLLANGQPVTIDNLSAAGELLEKRGGVFKGIKDFSGRSEDVKKEQSEGSAVTYAEPDFDALIENFTSRESAAKAFEEFTARTSETLSEQMLSADMGYLDVRALSAVSKQLSLVSHMAKQESYELPAVIDGELTSVNVHFQQDNRQNANVRIQINLAEGRQLLADFQAMGDTLQGYVGSNDEQLVTHMKENLSDFQQRVLSETEKKTDINIVYSEEVVTVYSNHTYLKNEQTAGKQLLTNNKAASEEVQGSHTSAKELYSIAKAFIRQLEAF